MFSTSVFWLFFFSISFLNNQQVAEEKDREVSWSLLPDEF